MLYALREVGLTAKPSKCVWGTCSLEYLGHEIGDGLVSVPQARIKALRDFHRPTNQKGLRTFLGTPAITGGLSLNLPSGRVPYLLL